MKRWGILLRPNLTSEEFEAPTRRSVTIWFPTVNSNSSQLGRELEVTRSVKLRQDMIDKYVDNSQSDLLLRSQCVGRIETGGTTDRHCDGKRDGSQQND